MQQVAKLPELLALSKDPLRELSKQLGLDEPQKVYFNEGMIHKCGCHPIDPRIVGQYNIEENE
jgi:hypothetical protein